MPIPRHINIPALALALLGMTLPQVTAAQSGDGAIEIQRFLNGAVRGLTDKQVVTAACKSQAALQQFARLAGSLQQAAGMVSRISGSLRARGFPTADLGVSIASSAYAKAASLGSKAEQYAATFAVASLCNTAQTRSLVAAQFAFLRDVVNKAIHEQLPGLDQAFTVADAASPSAWTAALRRARFSRLFAAGGSGAASISVSSAVMDSSSRDAYALADAADSAATAAEAATRALYAETFAQPELAPDGQMGCPDVAADGSMQWRAPYEDGSCGPASVGRSTQVGTAALALTASQNNLLTQVQAERIKLQASGAHVALHQDAVEQAAQWIQLGMSP